MTATPPPVRKRDDDYRLLNAMPPWHQAGLLGYLFGTLESMERHPSTKDAANALDALMVKVRAAAKLSNTNPKEA